jgi:tRNA G37 N-methylase Trm5
MTDNPLEPGPQDYDRINVNVESEIVYWSKELGVSRERLAQAIEEVGEKVVDVRRRLALG